MRQRVLNVINPILSGFLWLLGFLTLLFNLLGWWGPWHLAGFGFVFYIPIPLSVQVFSLISAFFLKDAAQKKRNLIVHFLFAGITSFWIFFTVFISSTWFW